MNYDEACPCATKNLWHLRLTPPLPVQHSWISDVCARHNEVFTPAAADDGGMYRAQVPSAYVS